MNVTLEPRILRWARERAGLDESALARKLGIKNVERVTEWETTGELPYVKAELLAQKTYTPFGFLFLKVPPEDKLPIPDFQNRGRCSGAAAQPRSPGDCLPDATPPGLDARISAGRGRASP